MTTLLDSPSDGSFSTPGMAIVFSFTPWWASLPSFYVSSDAAGAQGYRAIFDHEWFVDKWPPAQQPLSIPCKELFLVVVVVHLKCSQWVSKQVEFCSDIMTVVSVLPLSSSKNPNMMILLHHLSLVDVHHSFTFNTSHSVGCDNYVADTLSHLEFQHFYNLAPYAAPETIPVPSTLLDQLPKKIMWILPCKHPASSMRQAYSSAQHQFLEFCCQDNPFHSGQLLLQVSRYRNALLLFGSNLPSYQLVTTDLIAVLHRSLKSWQCGALGNQLPRLLWIPESWWIYSE